MGAQQIKIYMLGQSGCFYKGKEIDFHYQKILALIFYLILNPGPHSRERLSELLWSRLDIELSLSNLSRNLYYLKQANPEIGSLLSIKKEKIEFAKSICVWVDVFEFERVLKDFNETTKKDKAIHDFIELYRGNFLEDFHPLKADNFNDWVYFTREKYKQRFLEILNPYIESNIKEGKYKQAVELVEKSLKVDAFQETVYQKLMLAYYGMGKRSLALEQYKICEKKLKEGLDLAPLPETVSVYRQILQEKPQEQGKLSPDRIKIELPCEGMSLPLVGREKQLDFLLEKFSNLKETKENAVFITGEAGIGKTRFVLEFLEKIKNKAYIVHSKCYNNQKHLGYHPVINAFRDFFKLINYNIPLENTYLRDLLVFFPEMEELFSLSPHSFLELSELRGRLFESFYRMILSFCKDYPLVFFVDDLGFSDKSSRELLHYLSCKLKGQNYLLVCNFKNEDFKSDAEFEDYISSFKQDKLSHILELKRLNMEDLLKIIKVKGKFHKDFMHAVFKETSGIPFYLSETLNNMCREGNARYLSDGKIAVSCDLPVKIPIPSTIKEKISLMWQKIDPESRDFLEYAAVLGEDFSVKDISLLVKKSEANLYPSFQRLIQKNILNEYHEKDAAHYVFSHDKIMEFVYRQISETKLILLHEKVAAFYKKHYKKNSLYLGKIAYHYLKGEKKIPALDYFIKAGDYFQNSLAYDEAAQNYLAAYELAEEKGLKIKIVESLGALYIKLGKYQNALKIYDETVNLYSDDPLLRAQMKILKAPVYYFLGRFEFYRNCYEECGKILNKNKGSISKSQYAYYDLKINCGLAFYQSSALKLHLARKTCFKALKLLEKIKINNKDNIKSGIFSTLSRVEIRKANLEKSKNYVLKSLKLAKRSNDLIGKARAYRMLGNIYLWQSDYQKAQEFSRLEIKVLERLKMNVSLASAYCFLGWIYLELNDLEMVRKCLDKAALLFGEEPPFLFLLYRHKLYIEYCIACKDVRGAEKGFKQYADLLAGTDYTYEKFYNFYLDGKILSLKPKEHKKARHLLLKAADFFRKNGAYGDLAPVLDELILISRKKKNINDFKKYKKEALKIYKIMRNERKIKLVKSQTA